jgi:hypothetical protein
MNEFGKPYHLQVTRAWPVKSTFTHKFAVGGITTKAENLVHCLDTLALFECASDVFPRAVRIGTFRRDEETLFPNQFSHQGRVPVLACEEPMLVIIGIPRVEARAIPRWVEELARTHWSRGGGGHCTIALLNVNEFRFLPLSRDISMQFALHLLAPHIGDGIPFE